MLIELKNITKKYKNKIIINNFTYSFKENKIYGLYGVNGVGKSTLLKILTNNINSFDGEVIKKEGIKINFLPDTVILEGNETLQNFLKDISLITKNKINDQDLKKYASELRLDPEIKFKNMSTGMKMKVKFFYLLFNTADIYILDEPFSNIDEESVKIMWDYIKSWRNNGKCVIISLHNKSNLLEHVDELVEIVKNV